MVTFIIPVYEPDIQRKRNLEFIYDRLSSADFSIIIGVQAEFLDEYYKKFNKAKVLNFFKSGPFNKSFILNSCMRQVDSKFIVLLDADIYFNFDFLKEITEKDEIIKPFDECIYLNEEMTQEFISSRTTQAGPNLKRVSALGGGSILIRSDLIKDHDLLFDENFVGWGWEDIDFGDMLRAKGLKIRTINQPAAHLYHKPSVNVAKNSDYFFKKNRFKSKLIHIFNCFSQDCVELLESKIKYKKQNVLFVNSCDIDYLNNDNFKFIYSPKEKLGYNLESIISSCFIYLEDDGWIVYTGSSNVELKYEEIIKSNTDYIRIFDEFNSSTVGFAVRKTKWQKTNIKKLYIENLDLDLLDSLVR